jgi:dTDP-4-amino-4,6-dideoxygalactose transaminase
VDRPIIPFLDLRTQYGLLKDDVIAAIGRVLESGHFVLGEDVDRFEAEFASYCGADYGVAVNSGTSALHLAMLASGVGPGDEVITVPMTFVATVAAVLYTGAKPVFVDIDRATLTMDPEQLQRAITKRTKAVLPVHLHGQAADMGPILDVARSRGLVVIEDAAQAHGAEYAGRRVGGIGDLGCFSFYPGKNLGAYGEGGMVLTNNAEYASKIRMLRDWGQERKYEHVMKGYNYRMEAVQGAVLRIKLKHLDRWNEGRRERAALYDELLGGSDVEIPRPVPGTRHVFHVYAIRTGDRERLRMDLELRGIQTSMHYPIPVHLQPAYRDLGYKAGDFPESEDIARKVLSLPLWPEMPREHVESVARAIKECVGAG